MVGRPYERGGPGRLAVPARVRRAVAMRYIGTLTAGRETFPASCAYCGASGSIYWPHLGSGRRGAWVAFTDLSLEGVA